MSDLANLTDGELRRELKQFGFDAGPVSEFTRSVLQKKLVKLRKSSIHSSNLPSQRQEANDSWNEVITHSGDQASNYSLPQRQEANDSPNEVIKRSKASKYYLPSRFAYVQRESERGKHGTPGGRFSPTRNIQETPEISNDIPKWLVMIFGSFTLVLAIAYFFTAHPETVARTNRFVVDNAVLVFDHAVLPIVFLAIAGGITFSIYTVQKKYKDAGEEHERNVMELVDKIADRVQFADENGVAEQHLRDTFMPPTRRTEKDMELWNKAVSFINKMDSRMRSERRVISGVECDVWIWETPHYNSLE